MAKQYPNKYLMAVLMLLSFIMPFRTFADETWCAVTDTKHIVALSHINYLASTDDSEKFSIVLNDGTAVTHVSFITFSKYNFGGVTDIVGDNVAELKISGKKIVVTNAKQGASLSISDLKGRTMFMSTVVTDKQEVDISALAAGVYILTVDSKPMKFKKL